MTDKDNQLINSIDKLPDRIAAALLPALEENTRSKEVKDKSSQGDSKFLRSIAFNATQMAEVNKSFQQYQKENAKFIASLALTDKQIKAMDIANKRKQIEQMKFLNSISYSDSRLKMIDKTYSDLKRQSQIKTPPFKEGVYDSRARWHRQRRAGEGRFMSSAIGESPYIAPNLKPKSFKFTAESNETLLSKGAIPIDWKPNTLGEKVSIDLLGLILNKTAGIFTLSKKEQKEQDKRMKAFGKSFDNFIKRGADTIGAAVAPVAADFIYMQIIKGLNSYVRGATSEKDFGQRKKDASTVLYLVSLLKDPLIASTMGTMVGFILKDLGYASIKGLAKGAWNLGKYGMDLLSSSRAGAGIAGKSAPVMSSLLSKIPMLASLATLGVGVWGGLTGFQRGNKEGGLGEGLIRGAVNIPTSIAKSILQYIPGMGKFASGISDIGIEKTIGNIGKVISLSFQLAIKDLQNSFNDLFKKFPDVLKASILSAWKWVQTEGKKWLDSLGKNINKVVHPFVNEAKRLGMHTREAWQSLGKYVGGGKWSKERGATGKEAEKLGGYKAFSNYKNLAGHFQMTSDRPEARSAFVKALSDAQSEISKKHKGAFFEITGAHAINKGVHASESRHNYGTAVDIGGVHGIEKQEAIDILAKYGITRPNAKGDPIHFEYTKMVKRQPQELAMAKHKMKTETKSVQPLPASLPVLPAISQTPQHTPTGGSTMQTTSATRKLASNDPTKNDLLARATLNSLTA